MSNPLTIDSQLGEANRKITVLELKVKVLQDQYQMLLDYLKLRVETIPAQPAQQKLVERGTDGEKTTCGDICCNRT